MDHHPINCRLREYRVSVTRFATAALAIGTLAACSSHPAETAPPTISPAHAAVSPPVTGAPDGVVRALPGPGTGAAFDAATASLVVLGTDAGRPVVTVPGTPPVVLPAAATGVTGDGAGTAFLSTRGGYLRFDIGKRAVQAVAVDGQADTDFTSIARRADGKLALGTADGAVLIVDGTAVKSRMKAFARVDGLAAQGNTVVVLDRGQTSVTEVNADGTDVAQALRAGEGATTLAADPAGRVLVADTRGDGLLVFGTTPLMLRQQAPVRGAPYGIVGSAKLAWVSQTATNSVVGYDLSTGIPVEKVRYRTVQQPDVLSFDERTGTLFVVSGSGAGVQVIANAAAGPGSGGH
ncbi:YncE family protein [Mycobacterium sp. SMC-21]|uniref:YncE family protein n=1 Tax=Mycobacterium sp. SMC-21 TaxID=3381632 RepID=UPI003875DC56